jgi:hypothetical protein
VTSAGQGTARVARFCFTLPVGNHVTNSCPHAVLKNDTENMSKLLMLVWTETDADCLDDGLLKRVSSSLVRMLVKNDSLSKEVCVCIYGESKQIRLLHTSIFTIRKYFFFAAVDSQCRGVYE